MAVGLAVEPEFQHLLYGPSNRDACCRMAVPLPSQSVQPPPQPEKPQEVFRSRGNSAFPQPTPQEALLTLEKDAFQTAFQPRRFHLLPCAVNLPVRLLVVTGGTLAVAPGKGGPSCASHGWCNHCRRVKGAS